MAGTYPPPPLEYAQHYSDDKFLTGRSPGPPPLPPKGETFTTFGAPLWHDEYIARPLETLGIRRLHPQNFDRKRELKKALHSILAMFVDLTDMLIRAPRSQKRCEKLEDINLLFIHMQHLLNEYRTHQARDAVSSFLEQQRKQTTEMTERINLHVTKATEVVASCSGSISSDSPRRNSSTSVQFTLSALQSRLASLFPQESADLESEDAVLCRLAVSE